LGSCPFFIFIFGAQKMAPPLVSGVLIISSLENLLSSKEAKRNAPFKQAITAALDLLRNSSEASAPLDPRALFEPLRMACETNNYALKITALDCIGKLVSRGGYGSPSHSGVAGAASTHRQSTSSSTTSPEPATEHASAFVAFEPGFADQVVDTVCGCFVDSPSGSSSGSDAESVNLHLISALLSLVLSSSLPIHQTSLLKSVRTVYNVFLLSRAHQNQMVAQAALGQIVSAVFGRVQTGSGIKRTESRTSLSLGSVSSESGAAKPDVGDAQSDSARDSVDTAKEPSAVSTAVPDEQKTDAVDGVLSVEPVFGDEARDAAETQETTTESSDTPVHENGDQKEDVPSELDTASAQQADQRLSEDTERAGEDDAAPSGDVEGDKGDVNGTSEPGPASPDQEDVKPKLGPSVPVDLNSSTPIKPLPKLKRHSTESSRASISVPNGSTNGDEEKVTL
jgi:hypothetical protein